MTFLMGDVLEQTALLLARLAGVDVVSPGIDGKQEGGVLDVNGVPISWHLDMTARDPNGVVIPIDIKSMSEIGFGEFEKAIVDPSAKWWTENRWSIITQLRTYMVAKSAPYGIFVGISKNTGHMAELHVPPDPSWLEEFQARVAYVEKARTDTALPPRPPWAVTETKTGDNLRADGSKGAVEEIKHWMCSYCDFRAACWPDFLLVPLKSGPKFRRAV